MKSGNKKNESSNGSDGRKRTKGVATLLSLISWFQQKSTMGNNGALSLIKSSGNYFSNQPTRA